jgi:putative addiction module killer protein
MRLTVVEYIRENESNPYREWFDGLDPQAAAKVATAVLRLEMGDTSSVKWIGTIGEYRIDWGPGYRIYLARDGNALVILLGGGVKKSQRTDMRRAEALFAEYKSRKAAARSEQKRGTTWH